MTEEGALLAVTNGLSCREKEWWHEALMDLMSAGERESKNAVKKEINENKAVCTEDIAVYELCRESASVQSARQHIRQRKCGNAAMLRRNVKVN